MNFEWDDDKARRNQIKHGVSFAEAATVFGNPLAITYPDPDHSAHEQRWLTMGYSERERLLVIAHADGGENTRIISARKATRKERQAYEEQNCRRTSDRYAS